MELRLWTLGAAGQNREQRIAEREVRAAARRERYNTARRARRGAAPKKAKLKEQRPWEGLGISERTWRRRQAAEVGRKNGAHNIEGVIRAKKTATQSGDGLEAAPPSESARPFNASSAATAKTAQVRLAIAVIRLGGRVQKISEKLAPPERLIASIQQFNAKSSRPKRIAP